MWECPKCERSFKTNNQSHSCTTVTIDDLFDGKDQDLILVFDTLLSELIQWEPTTVGTSTNTIIFTSKKAWLIVKPMTKVLDLKFYLDEHLNHHKIHKVSVWGKKYAHHIRVSSQEDLDTNTFKLLRKGFEFSLKR